MKTKDLNYLLFYNIRTLIFIYFHIIIFIIFILINEQISPSKDGLRAKAVYYLAEIIIKVVFLYLLQIFNNEVSLKNSIVFF